MKLPYHNVRVEVSLKTRRSIRENHSGDKAYKYWSELADNQVNTLVKRPVREKTREVVRDMMTCIGSSLGVDPWYHALELRRREEWKKDDPDIQRISK